MTARQISAIDYFQRVTSSPCSVEETQAVRHVLQQVQRFSGYGHEAVLTGGSYAIYRAFHSWHSTGMDGGILKFTRLLKIALRASMVVVDRTKPCRRVQGFHAGVPHFNKQYGPCFMEKEAARLRVRELNLEAREEGATRRYRVDTPRQFRASGGNLRVIVEYHLKLPDFVERYSIDDMDDGLLAHNGLYTDSAEYSLM